MAAGFKSSQAATSETGPVATADEYERFGMSHAEAGAYLMDLWGLPATLVEAIAFHHHPEKARAAGFTALTAVHVANALVHERDDATRGGAERSVHFQYLFQLRLLDRLDGWRKLVRESAPELAGAR
jgi:HD-like signal output (HDOD) protein